MSDLVPTNIVDAKYLDASNMTVPGRIVESGQAELLSDTRYSKHHTCSIQAPDKARSTTYCTAVRTQLPVSHSFLLLRKFYGTVRMYLFFFITFTFQLSLLEVLPSNGLLYKPLSQVFSLLPPITSTCLRFLSRIRFSILMARRCPSNFANSRSRALSDYCCTRYNGLDSWEMNY